MSKGYIQSSEKIRDRLLVSEWELSHKRVAMRRCVGARRGRLRGGVRQALLQLQPSRRRPAALACLPACWPSHPGPPAFPPAPTGAWRRLSCTAPAKRWTCRSRRSRSCTRRAQGLGCLLGAVGHAEQAPCCVWAAVLKPCSRLLPWEHPPQEPDSLDIIADPHLRMKARACIRQVRPAAVLLRRCCRPNRSLPAGRSCRAAGAGAHRLHTSVSCAACPPTNQATDEEYVKVWAHCTAEAQKLSNQFSNTGEPLLAPLLAAAAGPGAAAASPGCATAGGGSGGLPLGRCGLGFTPAPMVPPRRCRVPVQDPAGERGAGRPEKGGADGTQTGGLRLEAGAAGARSGAAGGDMRAVRCLP